MLDEEKKAIEILKDNIKSLEGHTPFKHTNYEKVQAIETILNLIEKQSKEIEELKEKNRQGKMRIVQLENEITARIEDVNKYYTSNDKIKAKIDYLLKHYDSENFINFEMFIKILQSLLKEE